MSLSCFIFFTILNGGYIDNPYIYDENLLLPSTIIVNDVLNNTYKYHDITLTHEIIKYFGILNIYSPYNSTKINCYSMDTNDCLILFKLSFQLRIKLNWNKQDPCNFGSTQTTNTTSSQANSSHMEARSSHIDTDSSHIESVSGSIVSRTNNDTSSTASEPYSIHTNSDNTQNHFARKVTCSDNEYGYRKITGIYFNNYDDTFKSDKILSFDWDLIEQLQYLEILSLINLNIFDDIYLNKIPNNLEYLSLDHNKFFEIIYPDDIDDLHLEGLYLQNNIIFGELYIHRLPPSLRILEASNNFISMITYPEPASLLEEIQLNDNIIDMIIQLNAFPMTLEILNLNNNYIHEIIWEFIDLFLPNLVHLDLSDNKIITPNNIVVNLPERLGYIDLNGNELNWMYIEDDGTALIEMNG